MMGLSTVLTASILALRLFTQPALAAPSASSLAVEDNAVQARASSWWLANIRRQGFPAYGDKGSSWKVFRNVQDYGAKGDGTTDDTDAINRAITDGGRCGQGCDSSTTTPALVYFPPGTYLVSRPIIPYYYTQMVGDVLQVPTLKAAPNFAGIAVIDSDPYDNRGNNWWTNQNNFFRQVRNFKIDLTAQPMSTGTGIHWQVAQATSLQNIEFNMNKDKSANNRQQGIFMDNGSGGWMVDLTFNGGNIGAFFGNQQFTTRNLKFNGCKNAIVMNWNWLWTFQGVEINDAQIGIDMTAGGNIQTVGSIILIDSKISNTPVGVNTVYTTSQSHTNGTLVLDNVDMRTNVPVAVQNGGTKATILAGNTLVKLWAQGRSYSGTGNGKAVQGTQTAINKPAALLDGAGRFVTKTKPQYNNIDASKFVSVKSRGAKGDGKTDDTAAIQAVFNSIAADQIVYFDHGAYVMTNTVRVPKNIKIVGEHWPLIMAGGSSAFKDQNNPKPVWQVGQKGDVGNIEIQDLIFETLGPQPGAILMEWNVAGQTKGSAGLFDVHFRVGGTAGTQLQSDKCSMTPQVTTKPDPACFGAFMLVHVTSTGSIYMENTWLWVADHELDRTDYNKINIYNGRGILIESTQGAWLWGTASEHNVLVNYQFSKARNVFMGCIQTETAYMQGNPDATVPYKSNPAYTDPDFSKCTGPRCARTWGVRAVDSSDIYVYGGGLYSFFDNYAQQCVGENNCQDNMISLENSKVTFFGVSTKASVNMITVNNRSVALDKDNRNNFCGALAMYTP